LSNFEHFHQPQSRLAKSVALLLYGVVCGLG
jgi:hypothetical protein